MNVASPEALEAAVAGAAAGDLQALGALFERFYNGVHRYAYLRTGHQHDAEEIASEVFTRMVSSIRSYHARGPGFGAWLYGIARNVVADHHRARARNPEDLAPEVPDHETEHLEEIVTAREDVRRLRAALASLPDEEAHILTLRFAGGLSSEEVGSVIGKSAGAVRIQQMRALQRLRERMQMEAS